MRRGRGDGGREEEIKVGKERKIEEDKDRHNEAGIRTDGWSEA